MPEENASGIERGRGSFTGPGGISLFEHWWLPETEPRAVVVLVHGLKDHGARYVHVGGWLAGRGYAVHAPDLRGHGASDGERFFVNTFDEYVGDLEVFIGRVQRRTPERLVFLLGHSMGGAVASLFVLDRSPNL